MRVISCTNSPKVCKNGVFWAKKHRFRAYRDARTRCPVIQSVVRRIANKGMVSLLIAKRYVIVCVHAFRGTHINRR
jgi:hypothetical protein